MPLSFLARVITGLLSFAILIAAGYLLYTWYTGVEVRLVDGGFEHHRDAWRLYAGLAALAFSFLGRLLLLPLLGRGERGEPTRPLRENGRMIDGVDGARLYVESHGPADGQPIILTHGWGMDSTIWLNTRRALQGRFRVITWDLPGLGRSKAAPGAEGVSLNAFADNLVKVMDLAGGRPVVLAGHSIGGIIIQTLNRDRPEQMARVAGVALVNTTHTNPLRTLILSRLWLALQKPVLEPVMHLVRAIQPLAWLGAWKGYLDGTAHLANLIGFGPHVTRSQLEHVTLLATRNPPGVLARGNLAMFHWDATEALPRLNVPTLVFGGDIDLVTKLEASQTIAERAPRARLQVVEAANHMGFLDRAEIYHPALAAFADSVAGVPPAQAAAA